MKKTKVADTEKRNNAISEPLQKTIFVDCKTNSANSDLKVLRDAFVTKDHFFTDEKENTCEHLLLLVDHVDCDSKENELFNYAYQKINDYVHKDLSARILMLHKVDNDAIEKVTSSFIQKLNDRPLTCEVHDLTVSYCCKHLLFNKFNDDGGGENVPVLVGGSLKRLVENWATSLHESDKPVRYVIQYSGEDVPGLVHAICSTLFKMGFNIDKVSHAAVTDYYTIYLMCSRVDRESVESNSKRDRVELYEEGKECLHKKYKKYYEALDLIVPEVDGFDVNIDHSMAKPFQIRAEFKVEDQAGLLSELSGKLKGFNIDEMVLTPAPSKSNQKQVYLAMYLSTVDMADRTDELTEKLCEQLRKKIVDLYKNKYHLAIKEKEIDAEVIRSPIFPS